MTDTVETLRAELDTLRSEFDAFKTLAGGVIDSHDEGGADPVILGMQTVAPFPPFHAPPPSPPVAPPVLPPAPPPSETPPVV